MRNHGFQVVTWGHEELIHGSVCGVTHNGIKYREIPSISRDVSSVPGDFNYSAEISAEVVDTLLWAYHHVEISYWDGSQWETLMA